jgi:hypothetical protein
VAEAAEVAEAVVVMAEVAVVSEVALVSEVAEAVAWAGVTAEVSSEEEVVLRAPPMVLGAVVVLREAAGTVAVLDP